MVVRRKQHGMLEWLLNAGEYNIASGGTIPEAVIASLTRAVRSGSKTAVIFGSEFNPETDVWDDVIRFIESNLLAQRKRACPVIVNRNLNGKVQGEAG